MCTNQIWLVTKSMKLLIRISLKGTALSSEQIVTFKTLSGRQYASLNGLKERNGWLFDVISHLGFELNWTI